jgi:hypothetical protein
MKFRCTVHGIFYAKCIEFPFTHFRIWYMSAKLKGGSKNLMFETTVKPGAPGDAVTSRSVGSGQAASQRDLISAILCITRTIFWGSYILT